MFRHGKFFFLTFVVFVFSTSIAFCLPLEKCADYAKLGYPSENGQKLCRKGYLLLHNAERKTPVWVIEHLTRQKALAKLDRTNKFAADDELPSDQRAELSDYEGSGYSRGHMAPCADMQWDQGAMNESFYLSNMVPQNQPMNGGIWQALENHVRDWAIARNGVYIFTGPIYQGKKRAIGENQVAVPSHIYKIVYDPHLAEAIAFIMPNEPCKTADMEKYIVTIREIEEKTGLDFLSRVDKHVQDVVEKKKAKGLWE